MYTPLSTDVAALQRQVTGLVTLLEQAAGALPDACLAHRDGVPREVVERLQGEIHAARGTPRYPEDALPEDFTATVVVSTTSLKQSVDYPNWLALKVDRAFLRQLRQLQWLCKATGVHEVSVLSEGGDRGSLRWSGERPQPFTPRLVVDSQFFRFTDGPRHFATADIEVRALVRQLLESHMPILAYDDGINWLPDVEEALAARQSDTTAG